MSNSILQFHPLVLTAFAQTHEWLNTTYPGYRSASADVELSNGVNIAAQFDEHMPAHAFKAQQVFEQLIREKQLSRVFAPGFPGLILDTGCGGGAASVGLVNAILSLLEQGAISIPTQFELHFIGTDPNEDAFHIYHQMMSNLKASVAKRNICITYELVDTGIPHNIAEVLLRIRRFKSDRKLRYLPYLIAVELNVVRWRTNEHKNILDKLVDRIKDGFNLSVLGGNPVYGEHVAASYLDLLKNLDIDEMTIITAGTAKGRDKDLPKYIRATGTQIERVFRTEASGAHVVENWTGEDIIQTANYKNPEPGRWWRRNPSGQVHVSFAVDIRHVVSHQWISDDDWLKVISINNLKLAWARVRYHLLREGLIDELEIRLFEYGPNLEKNLSALRDQLVAYRNELGKIDQRLLYTTPKSEEISSARPRVLSRIEEDILLVSIIQVIGEKQRYTPPPHAYANQLDYKGKRNTEFLYEYWGKAWTRFRTDVFNELEAVQKEYPNAVVLLTDVTSFYTNIRQSRMLSLGKERTPSERILQLLTLLLENPIPQHEDGLGILQGGAASGFLAELYLRTVDTRFERGNEWDVRLYRYADDMVLVIPNKANFPAVRDELIKELGEIGLELSPDSPTGKTLQLSAKECREQFQPDNLLDAINADFERLLSSCYLMNEAYHRSCNKDTWWEFLRYYQQWLASIGIYVSLTQLSRKIQEYRNPARRNDALGRRIPLLTLPDFGSLPESISVADWQTSFQAENVDWLSQQQTLKDNLESLLLKSWEEYSDPAKGVVLRQVQLRRISYAMNRLIILGFDGVVDTVFQILQSPWMTKNLNWLLENLARQGYQQQLLALLESYQDLDHEAAAYPRACVLRAIRFLPYQTEDTTEVLCAYAKDGNEIERLMALESLIWLTNDINVDSQELNEISESLDSGGSFRLVRDQILLTGKVKNGSGSPQDDAMLADALACFAEGDIASLLEYPEPSSLRDFYGAEYPTLDEPQGAGNSRI